MELRIGMLQLISEPGDARYDPRPANLERALRAIDAAAAEDARLLVLGEAYLNGYATGPYSERWAVAAEAGDPFVAPLVDASARHGVTLIVGATSRTGPFPGAVHNSAVVIDAGTVAGVYSKTHVPALVLDDGSVASERSIWDPGDELRVFDTSVGRIGVEICFDIWYPEVARTLALKGAELIVNDRPRSAVSRSRGITSCGHARPRTRSVRARLRRRTPARRGVGRRQPARRTDGRRARRGTAR